MFTKDPKIPLLLLALLAALPALGQTPKKAGSAQTPPPRRVRFGSDPELDAPRPEDEARMREYGRGEAKARDAFVRGDLAACRRWCRSALLLDPDDANAACLLTDVCFRENRTDEAYRTVAPFVQRGAETKVLLRAALASGLRGEQRPGVEDYCRRWLVQALDPKLHADSFPKEGTPKTTALCAALALGVEAHLDVVWDELYYGIALRLDPGNPLANLVVGRIDVGKGRIASGRARLHLAARRGNLNTRDAVQDALRRADRIEAKTTSAAKAKIP